MSDAYTLLRGGRVCDPAGAADGTALHGPPRDLYLKDGRIAATPPEGARIGEVVDLDGRIVMAGAIDIHSHIGGGKVNLARLLLPEEHRQHGSAPDGLRRSGSGLFTPSSFVTGYRYAEMGYTAAFEPAMLPSNARHTHLELADVPIIDKGCYAVLGNDDFLLERLAAGATQFEVNDYVAWMLHATQAVGVKVVNPGGISAFKFNQRRLDLDEAHPHYGITPRRILTTLATALSDLGVPHPLHIHCNNLGIPGNESVTRDTIAALDGLPAHLTHLQFHSYGTEGDRRFSSAAAEIAEAVNRSPNISVDVGQIVFGQTITASADIMSQFRNSGLASPRKWVCTDIECDGGCGLVPFRYRDKAFVNALQWAIGLELFLLIADPWRVYLTTDHPNGGPFTSYPHLIRLLMDRSFRNEQLARINPDVAAHSRLGSIEREYTLEEIAIMTRAGPARVLGLRDRGHLRPGAVADVVVYDDLPDREAMFAAPAWVFKNGRPVARNGQLIATGWGDTIVVRPDFDPAIERRLKPWFEDHQTVRLGNFRIADGEILDHGRGGLSIVPTLTASDSCF